ncbi:MAG TPA: hypothetical protein VN541_12340 [Tepidisphaeraceae bacterium]|nr:hypothetical protein [Tepidisphaeraceae bacterium]
MTTVVDIFALLTAAAGWYYMFYSRAARRLDRIEASERNTLRVRLRRLGGLIMLLLGVLFFAGFQSWVTDRAGLFIGVWIGVLFLLLGIVVLALIDVRLTWKLRHQRRRDRL